MEGSADNVGQAVQVKDDKSKNPTIKAFDAKARIYELRDPRRAHPSASCYLTPSCLAGTRRAQ